MEICNNPHYPKDNKLPFSAALYIPDTPGSPLGLNGTLPNPATAGGTKELEKATA